MGDFFGQKVSKNGHFCQKSSFLKVFDQYLQFLSLVLAENFLKSSSKYLLVCASSGTCGKIQNWGFFWPKNVKKLPFLPKIQFFEGF